MKHHLRSLFLLSVCSAFACGVGGNDAQVRGTVVLTGVTDASAVVVTLVGPTGSQQSKTVATKSLASGAFVFEKIEKGDYLLTASVGDSLEQQLQVIVSKTDKAATVPALTFTLVATVSGQVNVQDAAGAPNAIVSISGSGASAVADANGAYEIRGVKLGTQAVAASFRDYPVATGQVEVTRGGTVAGALTLSLTPTNVVVPKGNLHGTLTMVEPGDFSFTTIRIVGSASAPTPVDPDGYFSLELDPGTYALVAETPFHASTDLGVHQVRSTIDLDLGSTPLIPFLREFRNASSNVTPFSPNPQTQTGKFLASFLPFGSGPRLALVYPESGSARTLWDGPTPPAVLPAPPTFSTGNGEQLAFQVANEVYVVDAANGSLRHAGFNVSNVADFSALALTASGKRIGGFFSVPGDDPRVRAYSLEGSAALERDLGATSQKLLLRNNRFLLARRTTTLSVIDLDGETLDDVAGSSISDAVNEDCVVVASGNDKYCVAAHGSPGSKQLAMYQPNGTVVNSAALANLVNTGDLATPSGGNGLWQQCAATKCIATNALLIRVTDGATVTQPAVWPLTEFTTNPSATRAFYNHGAALSCVEALTPGSTLDCAGSEQFAFTPDAQGWLSDTRWIGWNGSAHTVSIKNADAAATTISNVSNFGYGNGIAYWLTGQGTATLDDDLLFVATGDGDPIQVTSSTTPAQHRTLVGARFGASPDGNWRYVGGQDMSGVFSIQIDTRTNHARIIEGLLVGNIVTNTTVAGWLTQVAPTFEDVLIVHDTLQHLWVGSAGMAQTWLPPGGSPGRTYFYMRPDPFLASYQVALQP